MFKPIGVLPLGFAFLVMTGCGSGPVLSNANRVPTAKVEYPGSFAVRVASGAKYLVVSTNNNTVIEVYQAPFKGSRPIARYPGFRLIPPAGDPFSSEANMGLAVNSLGDVFISASTDHGHKQGTYELSPPYTSAPVLLPAVGASTGLLVNSKDDLISQTGTVDMLLPVCAPPYTSCSNTAAPFEDTAIAMGPNDDLFEVVPFGEPVNYKIDVFAPPYTSAPFASIQTGNVFPSTLSVDSHGDLFANNSNQTVTVYAPPYSAPPVKTLGLGNSGLIYFNNLNDLVDLQASAAPVKTYAPPNYNGQLIGAIDLPATSIAIDDADNLFVGVRSLNQIYLYSPLYKGISPNRIHFGMDAPGQMVVVN